MFYTIILFQLQQNCNKLLQLNFSIARNFLHNYVINFDLTENLIEMK